MPTFVDILIPIGGLLAAVALISASGIIVTGNRRRRQWTTGIRKLHELEGVRQEEQLEKIERAQRANDFLSDSLRRLYYGITLVCVVILISLPFLPGEGEAKLRLSIGLTAVEFLGALLLWWFWRTSREDRGGILWREVRRAQEKAHERRGLSVRDELTGVYTLDYWLHSLESSTSGFLRRPLPITALMLEISELGGLGTVRGGGGGGGPRPGREPGDHSKRSRE